MQQIGTKVETEVVSDSFPNITTDRGVITIEEEGERRGRRG